MARRRAQLGSSVGTHAREARIWREILMEDVAKADAALKRGACDVAARRLFEANEANGIYFAHREGAGVARGEHSVPELKRARDLFLIKCVR